MGKDGFNQNDPDFEMFSFLIYSNIGIIYILFSDSLVAYIQYRSSCIGETGQNKNIKEMTSVFF